MTNTEALHHWPNEKAVSKPDVGDWQRGQSHFYSHQLLPAIARRLLPVLPLQERHATPAASWHPTALGFLTLPVIGSWWALSISSLGTVPNTEVPGSSRCKQLVNSQSLKLTAT